MFGLIKRAAFNLSHLLSPMSREDEVWQGSEDKGSRPGALGKMRAVLVALWAFAVALAAPVAAQDVSVFLVNNPLLIDNRANYPVFISEGRGYPMRCATQAEEDNVIRALGFLTVPSRILEPTDPVIIDADPAANPDLCPAAPDYPIQVFVNSTPEGTKHYLQFVEERGSSTTTARLYVPGCVELIDALNVDLDAAIASDPSIFFEGRIHDISCNSGQTEIEVEPQTFAEWCAKADLTAAQTGTLQALLNATPGGSSALGNPVACSAAEDFLTSLTTLNLAGSNVSALEPLAALTELSALTLDQNAIVDIGPLAKMVNLTQLSLADNDVASVAGLAPLANLVTLTLAGNAVSDLRPLSSLTNLTTLDLGRNPLGTLAPLENLTALQNLSLAQSGQTGSGLEPLTSLQSLAVLDLTGNALTDLSVLGAFPSSVSIAGIGGNVGAATDFLSLCVVAREAASPQGFTIRAMIETLGEETCTASAAELASRVTLDLSGQNIADITPLSSASHLTELNLANNSITDIGELSGLTALRTLDLSDNDIEDITPLAPLTSLQSLAALGNALDPIDYLSACILRDQGEEVISNEMVAEVDALMELSGTGTCLASFTRLRTFSSVNLSNKGLTTLDLISVLQNATQLTISGNPVRDAAPLVALRRLTNLTAISTGLSETSGLNALKTLERLTLDKSPVRSLSFLTQLPNLKFVGLRDTLATSVTALAVMPNLETAVLWGMPLNPRFMREYCAIDRFTSGMLGGARNTVAAILAAANAAGVDPLNCSAVETWALSATSLNLNRKSISDLHPITLMPALKELYLQENNLQDVTELRFLRKLTTLNLAKNRLREVPVLFADALSNLYLAENQITNIGQVTRHTGLKVLDLRENRVASASSVIGLGQLTYLDLRDNRLANLSQALALIARAPYFAGNPICSMALPLIGQMQAIRARCNAVPPLFGIMGTVVINPILTQPIVVAPIIRGRNISLTDN